MNLNTGGIDILFGCFMDNIADLMRCVVNYFSPASIDSLIRAFLDHRVVLLLLLSYILVNLSLLLFLEFSGFIHGRQALKVERVIG